MTSDIGHLVATMDPSLGINEVAVTHRVLGVLLPGFAHDLVLGPNSAIHIAQQMERELLRLGERQVLGGCIERGTEDDRIELFESLGAVTQALALDGSTRCRRFGVPPQQHPPTAQVLEMDVVAVFVGQFEIRRNGIQRQHRQSLADLDGVVT